MVTTIIGILGVSSAAEAQYLYTDDADTMGGASAVTANFAQYTVGNKFTVGNEDIQAPEGTGFTFPTSAPITNQAWDIVNMEYSVVPPGPSVQQWTLATQDTSLTIGLDSQNRAVIYALNNPSQQFNWMQQPCSIPLPSGIVQNGQNVAADWQLQNASIDNSDGTKLTLRYTSTATGLVFESEWWARPGRGPIRHAFVYHK